MELVLAIYLVWTLSLNVFISSPPEIWVMVIIPLLVMLYTTISILYIFKI